MNEEPGVNGVIKIQRDKHRPKVEESIWGSSPVRVSITERDGSDEVEKNILVKDGEIYLNASEDGSLTLNLNLKEFEEVSFNDWQEGNYPGDE